MSSHLGKTASAAVMQEARRALGQRLRELRIEAGLTGQQLAELLSWPPSKVSKLENARQTPTENDLRAWTRATGREDLAEALLVSLRTLELQYTEWQRVLKSGLRHHQTRLSTQDHQTHFYRVFENTVVPGLLQTPAYARARFEQARRLYQTVTDVDEAVQSRLQRQGVLYRPDRRFHFVLTEAVLRYRLGSPATMLGQLDRLTSLSALPNVKLGIIGFDALYGIDPRHGFWLLDDDVVQVETYSAELNLRQPQEIQLYSQIFAQLAAPTVASYGRGARTLIMRAIDDLAPDPARDGS
ncbi:helix-turn-helix transcriptional regulator [Amycolatopsis dongchuanensis]|uniref:Helix-turn-helix transcriptional regulator n=2 Tax=Amycolatopsis dongchuanensis TaxID=1070866 RepID=A0ABP8VI78_9PSEU